MVAWPVWYLNFIILMVARFGEATDIGLLKSGTILPEAMGFAPSSEVCLGSSECTRVIIAPELDTSAYKLCSGLPHWSERFFAMQEPHKLYRHIPTAVPSLPMMSWHHQCCTAYGQVTRGPRGIKFIFKNVARIGEAANPGPFTIGTANPTGVLGKAHLLQELPAGDAECIWGLSETHLTKPGLDKFRFELKMKSADWRFHPGCHAPPLSPVPGTIGGKATGVGTLTKSPVRSLLNSWKPEDWATGRLQASAVFVQQNWVKVGVFYGFAKDAHTKSTLDRTDELLVNLTQRVVLASQGYRVIMGDFNCLTDAIPQFAIWRAHGFQELQEIAWHRWQRPIANTCKGKSVKDHVWVSPELASKLLQVHTDDTFFADHSLVYGIFSDLGRHEPVPIWLKPKPIPWETIQPDAMNAQHVPNGLSTYAQVFHALEDVAHKSLQAQKEIGLIAPQRGRGTTVMPTLARAPITPLRPSRSHEFQIQFQGENFQHTKWCRQLRRLQSYKVLAASALDSAPCIRHQQQLWASIRAAPGFPGGFPRSWQHRSCKNAGEPDILPSQPPDAVVARAIFANFAEEFRTLEKALLRHRRQLAAERRTHNSNLIYADVAKSRAIPVQTVVTKQVAYVTEVNHDGSAFQYAPNGFSCEQPVESSSGLLFAAEHVPGHIKLHKPAHLEPGDPVFQSTSVADRSAVFAAFVDLWKPMWTRHQDADPAKWNPFVQRLLSLPGAQIAMPITPITVTQWERAVANKKGRTATGPDGVSRTDLLRMPQALTAQFIEIVNAIDQDIQPWPQAALVGHISNVEKCPEASTPQQFRPITVLTLPYRVWASIRAKQCLQWLAQFAPEGMHGNVPGKSTVGVWWSLSMEIEAATQQGHQVSGFLTDLTKAFNNLPRAAVYACALHYGLPLAFVRSWHKSLSNLQRHFVVGGAVSGPVWGSNGYPEGDPLSVVAMVLLNLAMHSALSQTSPLTRVLTFVDNWEGISHDVTATHQTFLAMQHFADSVEVPLDHKKTVFWANNAADRKWLRDHDQPVVLHGSDLGGHLNYSRRFTNYTSRARIDKNAAFWGALTRSAAPTEQKLRAIATVAWPRCLHGIAGISLAGEHFGRLRAQAMASLKWNKKGASSTLQFGIGFTKVDPGFVALLDTVITFRLHSVPEVAFPVLSGLAQCPPRHFDPGPCGVFLSRLHEIQWSWDGNGFLIDHEGTPVHLIDSPIQFLKLRLRQGWERQVGFLLSERKDFGGLGWVDVEASQVSVPQSGEERGIIRSIQNGTFYTRDKQIHAGKVPSKDCPFCSAPDGLTHRIWECPHFEDLRANIPYDARAFLLQQPECTRLHSWMVQSSADSHWRATLSRHGRPPLPVFPPPPDDEVLHIFTDGGCLWPNKPRLRVASWAVVVASLSEDEYHPVASGLVPGPLQTSLRGELHAAITAFQYARRVRRKFTLWTDNQQVYARIRQYLTGDRGQPTPKNADHDLWGQLYTLVLQSRNLLFDVVKVVSHMDVADVSEPVDKWVIAGNAEADRLATEVLRHMPAHVAQALHTVQMQLQSRVHASTCFQRFLVAMGKRAIAAKEVIQQTDGNQWDELQRNPPAPNAPFSLHPLPDQLQAVHPHNLGPCFDPIAQWVRRLSTGPNLQGMWLCNYQLLVHFQSITGQIGFWYNRPKKEWLPADDLVREQGFDFCRFAAWLLAALKVFAKACDLPMTIQPNMPWGTCFRSWQRCIFIRAPVGDLSQVDSLLSARGPVALKTVQPLRSCTHFCPGRR